MSFTSLPRFCLAIAAILVFGGPSCSTNPSKHLANSWKLQKFEPGVDFSMSPEHMKVFKEFEQKAKMEFRSDGTYYFDLVSSVQEGRWELDKKAMMITTTSKDGVVTKSKVKELKADKLVLEQQSEGYTNLLVLVPKTE